VRLPHGKSVTLRLTLLFAAVSSFVLLLLGLVVGHLVDRHFEELDGELLVGKLELVRGALAEVKSDDDLKFLATRLEGALVGHHGLFVRILAADGQIVYVTANSDILPPPANSSVVTQPIRMTGRDGTSLRVLSGVAPMDIPGFSPAIIELATDLAHHETFMASFWNALWTIVALATVASGMLGWFAAMRGLAPLRVISRDAAQITAHRLNQRLPVESIPVELAEVVRTLNEMFARLEESFHRLSDFSSDLAHELRTPVSNLMTQTQVAVSRERSVDEYREVLYSNLEEFERLARMIADMLFLAKADNGLIIPNREAVNLAAEVREVFGFYEAIAEEQNVSLILAGEGYVQGDKLMLRRAFSNLLSNAIRHTLHHAMVKVIIAQEAESGKVRLTFENPGENIPAEHLPKLFDRFYRVDSSRQKASDGAGLGLAITKSIIEAHKGTIRVFSADGLTRFEIVFPAVVPS
jgi:two-component system heavy metal sensor histidine kinase CusS